MDGSTSLFPYPKKLKDSEENTEKTTNAATLGQEFQMSINLSERIIGEMSSLKSEVMKTQNQFITEISSTTEFQKTLDKIK